MRRLILCTALAVLVGPHAARAEGAGDVVLALRKPTPPPEWALLEQEIFRASTEACREFFAKYFDARGHLLCVERWGGDDGPDDAIENVNDWPILHALGAPDEILNLYRKALDGHFRQFTQAKTTDVPFARDGMYYKEFPVMFDWQHNGEGLSVFNLQGLSDAGHANFRRRVRRFAGFYMNEDPGAPNYDPQRRIIRSLFNGSRGPLLRKATALDWAGDPLEVQNRFLPKHGERNYQEMLAHFEDYTDVVGDHPLNLLATTLPLNAYMLTGEQKYRTWVLDYVDAWKARMAANHDVIPSNVGLDGTIGGECGGKWYGGTYGWGFSVVVPQTGKTEDRNRTYWGFVGFMNAYLLTGDDAYLEAWRKQTDAVNANGKQIDGRMMYPRMHGDHGWYAFTENKYDFNAREMYYLSMRPEDRERAGRDAWFEYLRGTNPDYPRDALRGDLEQIRHKMQAMRQDDTTPDSRLADDTMEYNPASVTSLLQLTAGGLHVERRGSVLHCRVRYFDPTARRAGIPEDVAALVESMDADGLTLSLVNVNQVEPRSVVIQAGGYAEHEFIEVSDAAATHPVNARQFTVRLNPGCGGRLALRMKRYVHQPTMTFPWDR